MRAVLGFIALSACGGQAVQPPAPVIAPGSVTEWRFPFAPTGASYPYLIYTPTAWTKDRQMPVLLLIHGAGGNGAGMLGLWQAFAEKHGILIVAPTFPLDSVFETYVPQLYPALMDTVRARVHSDPKRVYIFGYSAGAYSTYDAATLASTSFAAAGVFAGIITPGYDGIVAEAKRKTPVAIYIGDHDQFFSLTQTRRTRDLLSAAGFPVHYVEIAHQDHNYAAASAFVNADLWAYLRPYALP
jgi:poly(3-hydroxybutyrate) depolymerase